MSEDEKALALRLLADREAAQKALEPLSPREREVVKRVCQGEQEKTIGAQLGISDKTVSHHKVSAYRKTGTEFARLVVLVTRAGWV